MTANPDYREKYGEAITRVMRNVECFAEQYSVPLRIDFRRVRGF